MLFMSTTRELTQVNTILKDSVVRDNVKPTCAPDFFTNINTPASDDNTRPDVDFDNRLLCT